MLDHADKRFGGSTWRQPGDAKRSAKQKSHLLAALRSTGAARQEMLAHTAHFLMLVEKLSKRLGHGSLLRDPWARIPDAFAEWQDGWSSLEAVKSWTEE
jgi:hypothetical protein